MTQLIPLKQAAAQLSVSVRTLEREIADNKLAIHRIRSVRLVAPEELERYRIAAQCQSAKSANDIKCASASAVASVLNALYRPAPPVTTRGRSKLRSAALRSTLRLVEPQRD